MRVKHVVALALPRDIHASAVRQSLLEYGAEFTPIYSSAYPYGCKVAFEADQSGELSVAIDNRIFGRKSQPFTFWARRRGQIQELKGLVEEDAKIAADHSNRVIDGVAHTLSAMAKMAVNDTRSMDAAERSKMMQLAVACQVGLRIPQTIVSNEPLAVKKFFDKCDGRVIGKSIGPGVWHENGSKHLSATMFVDEADLPPDHLLVAGPVILQRAVPKAFEVRVNVMGDFVQAVRIDSKDPNGEDIDWRVNQEANALEPFVLPADLAAKLVALLRAMKLTFGAIDLIVGADGSYTFLEINQMGQILWIEERCPSLPVLDTFCQFLLSGDPHFPGPSASPRVSFEGIRAEAVLWNESEVKRLGLQKDKVAAT